MKSFFSLFFLFYAIFCFSQVPQTTKAKPEKPAEDSKSVIDVKATIDQYRIITLQRDTTYVDTSLTIKSEYRFNYLRKDIFGLLPFANEGQTYNTLQYSLNDLSAFPNFGFKAKHFNYLTANQINYYSVATPLTELYFKSVMEQGQNIDAFITLNTSERLNFSAAYKGLRSIGKYINQLSSTGNFRFTTSYNSKNKRYFANFHFVAQDILNGENGGIVNQDNFSSGDEEFDNRARIEVFLADAKSVLEGKRLFFDHAFRINPNNAENNIYLTHQFNYEYKFFEYSQSVIPSTITAVDGSNTRYNRFGESYVTANLKDKGRYNRMYNKLGAIYENKTLGKFQFFAEDFRYNYFFDKILITDAGIIPGALNDEIQSIGGQYEYRKNRWRGTFLYANSIVETPMTTVDAMASYQINERNKISFQYQNISKIPDHNFNLNQSSYVSYNWSNDFKNEKINAISVHADTQWATASLQLRTTTDHLYFTDNTIDLVQIVSPQQFDGTVNYVSLKVAREFRFRNFALDNTILYQKSDQNGGVLNVPEIVTRNTLYYSNHFFKKALYLQTGITLNYFTEYNADEYNPVIGEFFVQNQQKIGNFPMLDFFINARVRQTRIYLKAEHFNSPFTGNSYFTAPGYPYRDFMIRFGLEWNFFQ